MLDDEIGTVTKKVYSPIIQQERTPSQRLSLELSTIKKYDNEMSKLTLSDQRMRKVWISNVLYV